jgi:hypothetical protein
MKWSRAKRGLKLWTAYAKICRPETDFKIKSIGILVFSHEADLPPGRRLLFNTAPPAFSWPLVSNPARSLTSLSFLHAFISTILCQIATSASALSRYRNVPN